VLFIEKKPRKLPKPSRYVSSVIILFLNAIYRLLLLTHYLSLIFLRAWKKFIAEKEGEFKSTITFYTDYPVRNPNNNFRFEKI
jgi:hypothetical protein